MGRLKIAVIADNGEIPRFALDALDAVQGCDEVTVFARTDPLRQRAAFRSLAFRALTARHAWTRPLPVDRGRKRVTETVRFSPRRDGSRPALPPEVVQNLRDGDFTVVLDLAEEPLRPPSAEALAVPVLSLHLGDPERYRGGPAGFWEIANGEQVMAQALLVDGGRPEGGEVVAFAETKVFPHSYRATLAEAYRHTPLLLDKAIHDAASGTALPRRKYGPTHDVPSNTVVAGFVVRRVRAWLARQLYGAFFEKNWRVSTTAAPADPAQAVERRELLSGPGTWRTIEPRRGYVFYADPFFSDEPPGILVEALRSTSGRGEIVLVQGDDHRRVSSPGGHFSYPATVRLAGRQVILPEIAAWSSPICYALEDGGLTSLGPLDMDPSARILDPTLVEHGNGFYLFGNQLSVGSNALCIWHADAPSGRFRLHRMSPVLISPRGARMAGGFLRSEAGLLRFGQDFGAGYGDGIFAFLVEDLSPTTYRERLIGEIRFRDRKGPHTLNVQDGQAVFDWYQDRFAPLAGVRRLMALLHRS